MKELTYKGSVVNEAITGANNVIDNFSSLSSEMKQATSQILNARGFQEYVGGISSDSFSSVVEEAKKEFSSLVHNIRQQQVKILAYSEDKEEIKSFLDGLSRNDYNELDLTELNDYISFGQRASNIFKGVLGSIGTIGLGIAEGIVDFGETGADLLDLGKTAILSIFALGDQDELNKMWEETRARVSEKKAQNIFNSIYKDTEVGQFIKNNAYGFDTVRGISKGLGYTAGVIGVNILSGGLASGGIGAAGSITAGGLATTAGALGFANGTEEAWADGASTARGLAYGAATGLWEGAQWYMGAKINQIGGLGDRIAEGIFKGAKSGVGVRIGLDTLTAGADGFVRPAISMLYKDYDGATTLDQYVTAFKESGGLKNVATQAAIGAIASGVSEAVGARKLLKEPKQQEAATKVFESERRAVIAAEAMGVGDADALARLEQDAVLSGDYSQSVKKTISGADIAGDDNIFFRRSEGLTDSVRFLDQDGAYIPDSTAKGIFASTEKSMSAAEMKALIDQSADSMSGSTYTALHSATKVLEQEGLDVNVNELKLIVNHSEGNVGRIREALAMSYGNLSDETLDDLSEKMAQEVFKSSPSFKRIIQDDLIDELRRKGRNTWTSSSRIIATTDAEEFFKRLSDEASSSTKVQRVKSYFGPYLPEDTVTKIATSDGYPSTIRKILLEDGTVPENMLDLLSEGGAAKIFKGQNMARLKAVNLVNQADYDTARRLISAASGDGFFDTGSDLLKATHVFCSEEATRRAYYSTIDDLVAGGSTLREATIQAKMMDAKALDSLGESSAFLFRNVPDEAHFTIRDSLYNYDTRIYDGIGNASEFRLSDSSYMRRNYMRADGTIDKAAIARDFNSMMGRRKTAVQAAASIAGYDVNGSNAASTVFTDAYFDAASNIKNPNRRDALLFMSKMLEFDETGNHLKVVNLGAKETSQQIGNTINLDYCTIAGKEYETVYHEAGHYLFDIELGSKYPSTYEAVRQRAVSNLYSYKNTSLLDVFEQNEREINFFTKYKGDQILTEEVRGMGCKNLGDYVKTTTRRYDALSEAERMDTLKRNTTQYGVETNDSFTENVAKKVDFSSSRECAVAELNSIRRRMSDMVYRNEFTDYETISSVIDSTTRGMKRIHYGHGRNYYTGYHDVNYLSYHELVADYSSMRVRGDNTAIGFLRKIVGNELMDMLENTYKQMLQ